MPPKTNTETVTLTLPSGESVDAVVPSGLSDMQVRRMLYQKHPDLFRPGMPPTAQPEMKTNPWPGVVKGAASTLPVAGGIGGAVAGAPAFGGGALVGAGLGAAGGEAARQALMRNIFDEGPSPITKEGLKRIGITGAASAAAEVPGAIAATAGNRVLARIAEAKSPREVGNVIEAFKAERPSAISAKGLQRDLMMGYRRASMELRQALRGAQGTTAVDTLVGNARTEAALADITVPGTLKRFDRTIAAAKINAGIKGNQATADQLFELQKQIGKPGYAGAPGPASEVVNGLLKNVYRRTGQQLRVMSPQVDPILGRLTNLHAAQNAIKMYKPGTAASVAASAALHPRTTAAVSPLVAVGAGAGVSRARRSIKESMGEMIP